MDFLDYLTEKDEEVLTGIYFNRRPKTAEDEGIEFNYDMVNDRDTSFSTVLQNVKTQRAIMTIKTKAKIKFEINGYIKAQDGGLFQVMGFIKRIVNDKKLALRYFKETNSTEYTLRLIEVENAMDI